ncbi:MarC family protein [bacterium]|jgi:multiple antibiotic resistance protein|nr:MarC family protein [bacterium]
MLGQFALSFTAIFVALDIIGTLPLYISMTRGLSNKERKQIVNKSMFVALITAIVFMFLGQTIFHHLGIRISDFRIAGGIILLLVALTDLLGGPHAVHQKSVSGSTGIVPLAVPLITGPGVLTTLILQVGSYGYVITLAALFTNYLIGWGLLRKSEAVTAVVGKDGTVVLSKIAALLLAAIAVAMMRVGLSEAISAFSTK